MKVNSEVLQTAEKPGASGESLAHRELKRLAVEWARARRLMLCGSEVRLPRSNYRADVAAATPRQLSGNAVTAVFECKASRSDFLRDSADERATVATVQSLSERLHALNQLIGTHRPDLRLGEELFPEFDCIDLRGSRHDTHRAVTKALAAAQNALYEGTKFSKLTRWRAATFLYLVVDHATLVHGHEVPAGWGLLIREGEQLHCVIAPVRQETKLEERIALLERIASRAR
ncbi:hypothetical protein [Oleiharenicola lentus]|uniref:hypothetical protein n=1 Tax=Oleiharenicola lentus TaxID=2508720 RepID=UPI003F67BF6F